MNIDRPNNLGKSIDVRTSNRPIKIAYLVPYEESPVNHMVIDAVFYESYTRWAGAFTLIIPSNATTFLDPAYEAWLEFFDPDFVYSYVELHEDLVKNIDKLCSPIALLQHKIGNHAPKEITWQSYVCDWHHYFTPVSSITTIPSPQAQFPFLLGQDPEREITVVTQYPVSTTDRFLRDNFGTAFDIHRVTNPIHGLFKTLCFVPPDLPDHINVGTVKCTSMSDILSAIGSRNALTIAGFARVHSEAIPRVEPSQWAHVFNLFIGDALMDRIHFWNARHFTPSYATTHGALILGKAFFDDEDLVIQLGQYLNRNNFLGYGNGPYQVSLRSYSLSEEELCSIQDKLKAHTYNSVHVNKFFNAVAIPNADDFKKGYFRGATESNILKTTEDSNILSAEEPSHYFFIPPRLKGIAGGQWVVELDINRHNNLSKYSNVVDSWVLPRGRNSIVRAFTKRLGKVTIGGQLALLPVTKDIISGRRYINSANSFELFLPSDEDFFRYLVLDFLRYQEDDLRATLTKHSYQQLSISDKGQNLRGVISMFDSLFEAYEILTNRFWREAIREAKADSAKYLVFDRNKLESYLPNDRPTMDKLMGNLHLENIGQVRNFMISNLTDTLEYLVRINVFFQVYQWRCLYCGHVNSRSFDGMNIKNCCEICQTEYFAPIDLEWTYQLNDFVYRSLTKHNGLTVLWTLGFLQDHYARRSFWYLSELDLYEREDDSDTKNEIDILCLIDGRFFAVEVKRSASLFINKPEEAEKFITKINLINPDVAMLSFERYCETDVDIDSTQQSLSTIIQDIRKRINSNINLEIIVAYDSQEFNSHPHNLGRFGKRSHNFH